MYLRHIQKLQMNCNHVLNINLRSAICYKIKIIDVQNNTYVFFLFNSLDIFFIFLHFSFETI
jgi:hypothetical protein